MRLHLTLEVLVDTSTEEHLHAIATSYFIHQYGISDPNYTGCELFAQAIDDNLANGDFTDILSSIDHSLVVTEANCEIIDDIVDRTHHGL